MSHILFEKGIQCNWLRSVKKINPSEISEKLSENSLRWHLNRYHDIDPVTKKPFCDNTPFISTTAGTVEQQTSSSYFQVFPPFLTALQFATDGYTKSGYIFYAYLFTLGKKSIEFLEFAEETRDLHIYTSFQQFHPEGEVVAKVHIPSERLERWEYYEPIPAYEELKNNKLPTPITFKTNFNYQPPERVHNIRQLMV